MLRVKDMYVSIKDIKSIQYMYPCLVIKYMFNDTETLILVDDFDEFERLATLIADVVNGAEKQAV